MVIERGTSVERWLFASALIVVIVLCVAPRVRAQTLTNADVVKMVQAKLGDAVIISEIKHSTCNFDTSPNALIALKEAGVSDEVLEAMTGAEHTRTSASTTSRSTAAIPLPENYGIYAVDHGKLYSLFGGNPSAKPPMRLVGVYSFETNRLRGYSAAALGSDVTFVVFDQASGDLSRGLELYGLPVGRYFTVGGQSTPINGPVAARLRRFQIPLLAKPVPGQPQMVESSPSSLLVPGVYLLFVIRGAQWQAQLIVVGSPQAARGGACVDISFPGGYLGVIEVHDYWAAHGPPEFPEITPDHYRPCGGAVGAPGSSAVSRRFPSSHPMSPPPALPPRPNCSNYSSCVSEGYVALKNENWSQALADFKSGTSMNATKPEAWAGKGMADLPLGQGTTLPAAWDNALARDGTLMLRVWHYAGLHMPQGMFRLNSKTVSFIGPNGETVFAVSPSRVSALTSHHPPLGGKAWSFGMKVEGHRYWFSFVPLGVRCRNPITCSGGSGYVQEGAVSNYIVETIPKLASGSLPVAPAPPPVQPSVSPTSASEPAAGTSTAASTSPNASTCSQAASAGYSIRAGRQIYAVKKISSPDGGQIPVFVDQEGSPVPDGPLLHQLELGAWTYDNIIASPSTRAEITSKLQTLPDAISTSGSWQRYEAVQDVLARGMAEAIEAAVTGGTSLTTAVPKLVWGTVKSQLLNSPQTLLTLSAQVGLQDSLHYYEQLSTPGVLPPADSAVLKLTTLENVRALYTKAQALDLPNEVLASALSPTSPIQLTNQALQSVVSELIPGFPAGNEAVTMASLLDLQKNFAQAGNTLPALHQYNENLNLVLSVAAANDRTIDTWAAEAGHACTASGALSVFIPSFEGAGLIEVRPAQPNFRRIAKTTGFNNSFVVYDSFTNDFYVGLLNGNNVPIISADSFTEVGELTDGVGWNTFDLAHSHDGKLLVVVGSNGNNSGKALVFQTRTRALTMTLRIPNARYAIFSHDDQTLFVSAANSVLAYDRNDFHLRQQRSYPGWSPSPMAISEDGSALFVLQHGSLIRLNALTFGIEAQISLPEAINAAWDSSIEVSPNGNSVWVGGHKAIYGVRADSGTITPVYPPCSPTGAQQEYVFGQSSRGKHLYVLCGTSALAELAVLDWRTGAVTGEVRNIPFPATLLVRRTGIAPSVSVGSEDAITSRMAQKRARINKEVVGKWWTADRKQYLEFLANGKCSEGDLFPDGKWHVQEGNLGVWQEGNDFSCLTGAETLIGPNVLTRDYGEGGEPDRYYRGLQNIPKIPTSISPAQAEGVLRQQIDRSTARNTVGTCHACYDPSDKGDNEMALLVSTIDAPFTQFLMARGYIGAAGGKEFFTGLAKRSSDYGPDGLRIAHFENPRLLVTRITSLKHVPIEYEFVPTRLTMPYFGGIHEVKSFVSFSYRNEHWEICVACR